MARLVLPLNNIVGKLVQGVAVIAKAAQCCHGLLVELPSEVLGAIEAEQAGEGRLV